jgi:hypothetical protein
MTRSELEQLTDCGHDLAAKVARAIRAAAQVGPCQMEMQVDMETIKAIESELDLHADHFQAHTGRPHDLHQLCLTFMEVDAVIYARVQR